MIFVTTHGEYQVTTSDGVVRRFPAGSVLIVEDTTGVGHSTKITSAEDVLIFAVGLPANAAAPRDFSEPVDHVQMLSNNAAIVAGTWTMQSLNVKGYWSDVFEGEGQDWRIRLHSYSFTPQTPPASR